MKGLLVLLALVPVAAYAQVFVDDFEDGNANGWVSDQGVWNVASGVYRGMGAPSGNRVWNVSYPLAFNNLNVSVSGRLHTDTGNSDHVNKMIVLRYQDPQNFVVVDFRAGSRRDVVVEQIVNGNRFALTPEFLYQIPLHGQLEFHDCRVDALGQNVRAYFDGQLVMNVDIPTLINLPGKTGIATFYSQGGGAEEIYADTFTARILNQAALKSFEVTSGILSTGSVSDLAANDGNYVVCYPSMNAARRTKFAAEGRFTVVGPATRFELVVDHKANYPGVVSYISLRNAKTGQYELVKSALVTMSDTSAWAEISNAGRFVNSSSEVEYRLEYLEEFFEPAVGYFLYIDQVDLRTS